MAPTPQAVQTGPPPVAENVLRGQTQLPEPSRMVGAAQGETQMLETQLFDTQSLFPSQVSPSTPRHRPLDSSWLTGHSQRLIS